MSSVSFKVGSIDEKGYLAGMGRRGFTPAKCLLELLANILDAHENVHPPANFTKKAVLDVKADKTSLIDNGAGMLPEHADSMFSLHKSNHGSDTSRGVSGIGAKPAMSILSEKTTVKVFTHWVGGPYLCITVPWGEIHSRGIYTGMIDVSEMSVSEKSTFIAERRDNGMLNMNEAHGTTIQFETNNTLSGVIEATFAPISEEYALKNQLDRAGIVFGRDQVEFLYKNHNKPTEVIRLGQYDYFGAPNSQFYTGKTEHIVEQWHRDKDNTDRYILNFNGKKFEITQSGRGFSKDPEELKANMTGYHKVGNYTIVCGMRLDKSIFNPDTPVAISGKFTPGDFNMLHLGSELECNEFLWSMKLVRNNQLIGLIPNPSISLGSMRANGEAQIAAALVQVEIQFNPLSSHENFQDLALSIQENKNQFDGKSCPVQLTRIAGFVRSEKAKEVIKYMKDCIEAASGAPKEDEHERELRLQREKEAQENARLEKERLEKELIEKARIEKERLEKARLEKERLEKERLENDSESEDSSDGNSSEEEYVTGDDVTAWIHGLYDTITPNQKFNRADVVKLFATVAKDLFAE